MMKTYEGTIVSCDRENHVYRYLVEDQGRIRYAGSERRTVSKGQGILSLLTKGLLMGGRV
jgi:hypothetical protein